MTSHSAPSARTKTPGTSRPKRIAPVAKAANRTRGRRKIGAESCAEPIDATETEQTFIVSSSHLAVPGLEDLSAFEFALMTTTNAFQRWIMRGTAAAGAHDLAPLDIMILHFINHRNRRKSIADILFTLNLNERHFLNYATKKLSALGLIQRVKSGKEVLLGTTEAGRKLCEDYAKIRRICLLELIPDDHKAAGIQIAEVAKALRVLTGFYEQASRAASSL